MGNPAVGLAIGLAAQEAVLNRKEGEAALAILDRICRPYLGTDAEFNAQDPAKPGCRRPDFADYRDPHPSAALDMLMLEAFSPNGVADLGRYAAMAASEDALEAWYAEVGQPFNTRYQFWSISPIRGVTDWNKGPLMKTLNNNGSEHERLKPEQITAHADALNNFGISLNSSLVVSSAALILALRDEIRRLTAKLEFNEKGYKLVQAQKDAGDRELDALEAKVVALENQVSALRQAPRTD